jgi:GNAT superfamily N-acetyltransferase
MPELKWLSDAEIHANADALGAVLLDCIAGGASVSFMADFKADQARQFFIRCAADVGSGRRALVAAFNDERLDGTAQLLLDVPPNQPHRAELTKMLVHRRARRSGLGRALFDEVEREAIARGKTLLTFDTVTGSPAERMYVRCGCVKVGEIPGYALLPDGVPVATSVFYKELRIGLTNRHS